MMKKSVGPKVVDLLSKKFEEEEFKTLFLIDVTTNEKSGFIRVYLDGDQGVKFSDCQKISRYLESFLDEDPEMDEQYTLEVSSPGVKRPLEVLRQYPQHIGRILKVTWMDDKTDEFRLVDVKDQIIVIESMPSKKQIKKGAKPELIEVALKEIKEALVKISFK
jgi:ribosome maturation factor RimP